MKYFFCTALVLFAVFPTSLFAATVGISEDRGVPLHSEQTISLILDTEGEKINAIEGDILVFGDADIVDIRDGASFVSLWTEKLSFKDNSAHFSGIIPGGFNGTGEVLSLVLRGAAEGNVSASLSNVSVFLDDGMGTEEVITTQRVTLPVSASIQGETLLDTIPPEPFSVGLINVANGDGAPVYALVFATDDKQTGIDRYEVQEIPQGGEMIETGWHEETSPYTLLDQSQKSTYSVRAYDNVGNMRESVYKPESTRGMIGVVLGVLVLLVCLLFAIRYVRRPKRTK